MKSIELTQEQANKLLEMCKILYSEYELVTHDCQLDDLPIDLIGYRNLQTGSVETIHWFEFCIMNLTTKIYNLTQPNITITLMRGHISQNGHPIDLLYEQFKLIKTK